MLTFTLSACSGGIALLWFWPGASPAVPTPVGQRSIPVAMTVVIGVIGLATVLQSLTVAVEGPLLVLAWRRIRATADRRRIASEALISTVACVDHMALRLRAGRSLSSAFGEAVRTSQLGAGHPLAATARDVDAGTPLREALARHAGRPSDPSGRLLVTTVIFTTIDVLSTAGGPAAEALERTADTLRERVSDADDGRTQAQQAVTSAAMLSLLPALFAGLSAAVEPDLAAFYLRHWLGCVCVVAATVLTLSGWVWIERLVWEAP